MTQMNLQLGRLLADSVDTQEGSAYYIATAGPDAERLDLQGLRYKWHLGVVQGTADNLDSLRLAAAGTQHAADAGLPMKH